MVEKGKDDASEKAAKKHDEYIDKTTEQIEKAKALGKDVDALAAFVAEQILKHQTVKARVYDKLVTQGSLNAAETVSKSMEKSLTGHDKVLQAITKNAPKRQELESKGESTKGKVKEKVTDLEEEYLED